jgi:hypothetical protein
MTYDEYREKLSIKISTFADPYEHCIHHTERKV